MKIPCRINKITSSTNFLYAVGRVSKPLLIILATETSSGMYLDHKQSLLDPIGPASGFCFRLGIGFEGIMLYLSPPCRASK